MKNYELMQLLGTIPDGAEVKMNIIVTKGELTEPTDIDDNGCQMYSYCARVQDVDTDGDKTIYLYT